MGATAAVITVAAIGAAAGAGSAYMSGKSEQNALKFQYQMEQYNAQMDKAEAELDLARQDKLLQKQLAESVANTNNFFGGQLEGDAFNFLGGQFVEGQDETRRIKAQEQYIQNKYITAETLRRKAFNKNFKNNAISTGLNIISGAIGGAAAGYTLGNGITDVGTTPVKRNVTGNAVSGGNVRFTNASYKG